MSGTFFGPHGREAGLFALSGVVLSLTVGHLAWIAVAGTYLVWLAYISTMTRWSFRAPSRRKPSIQDSAWRPMDVATRRGDLRFYLSDTQPGADVVLVVHGWSSASMRMTGRARVFLEAGLNVVLVDLPSHGASASLPYWSAEESVSMLIDGLNHLHQQRPNHFGHRMFFFGHSMGGFVGLRISKRRNELSLNGAWSGWVLESPMTGYSEIFDETCRLLKLPRVFRWSLETRVLRKFRALNPSSTVKHLQDADMPAWGMLSEPTLLVQASNDERLGNAHHERLVHEMKQTPSVRLDVHRLDSLTHSGAHEHAERDRLVAAWLDAQPS